QYCLHENDLLVVSYQFAVCSFPAPLFLRHRPAFALYTTRPPTSVIITFPFSSHLSNGEFLPFDCNFVASTRHGRAGSKIVTSAGTPVERVPQERPKIRAGLVVSFRTASAKERAPASTSFMVSGSAVSKPTIPLAAWSNSTSFSSRWWGA